MAQDPLVSSVQQSRGHRDLLLLRRQGSRRWLPHPGHPVRWSTRGDSGGHFDSIGAVPRRADRLWHTLDILVLEMEREAGRVDQGEARRGGPECLVRDQRERSE